MARQRKPTVGEKRVRVGHLKGVDVVKRLVEGEVCDVRAGGMLLALCTQGAQPWTITDLQRLTGVNQATAREMAAVAVDERLTFVGFGAKHLHVPNVVAPNADRPKKAKDPVGEGPIR